MIDLAAVTDNIETLDVSDGATTDIILTGADIQSMVGDGNLSELTILADSGDNLVLGSGTLDIPFNQGVTADYTITDGTDTAIVHWIIG